MSLSERAEQLYSLVKEAVNDTSLTICPQSILDLIMSLKNDVFDRSDFDSEEMVLKSLSDIVEILEKIFDVRNSLSSDHADSDRFDAAAHRCDCIVDLLQNNVFMPYKEHQDSIYWSNIQPIKSIVWLLQKTNNDLIDKIKQRLTKDRVNLESKQEVKASTFDKDFFIEKQIKKLEVLKKHANDDYNEDVLDNIVGLLSNNSVKVVHKLRNRNISQLGHFLFVDNIIVHLDDDSEVFEFDDIIIYSPGKLRIIRPDNSQSIVCFDGHFSLSGKMIVGNRQFSLPKKSYNYYIRNDKIIRYDSRKIDVSNVVKDIIDLDDTLYIEEVVLGSNESFVGVDDQSIITTHNFYQI